MHEKVRANADGFMWCIACTLPKPLLDFFYARFDGKADLLERVTVANRDRLVVERLAVDCNAVGRANFVLAAIAAADRPFFVVEDVQAGLL